MVRKGAIRCAVTGQNTREVRAIHQVPPDFIAAQIDAVLEDIDVSAIRIGMPGGAEATQAVAASLDGHAGRPLVLGPVMIATMGARLLPEAALVHLLIPNATLVTPNLIEAALLVGEPVAGDSAGMIRQGNALLRMGASRFSSKADTRVVLRASMSSSAAARSRAFRGRGSA